MAYEQLGNIAKTTLTASYTTGGASITVSSTTAGTVSGYLGGFPANPTFRVGIIDQTTGVLKAVLKVTAVTDGTHWATSPDAYDGNANSGDIVAGPWVTAGMLTTLFTDGSASGVAASAPTSTTGARAGMRYKCTDFPHEFIFDGALWVPYAFGLKLTPPIIADWTTLGTGGTRTDLTTGAGYPCAAINILGTTGTGNIYGVSRTVAAGDFTHYFLLWASPGRSSSNEVMVGFTDGTKTEGYGFQSDTSTGGFSMGPTGIKSSLLNAGSYAAANGLVGRAICSNPWSFLNIKLTRVGTTLAAYLSHDGGFTYELGFSDTTPYLTASSVAVWTDPRSSTDKGALTLVSYS